LITDWERKRPFLPKLSELLPVLLDAAVALDPVCRRRHVRSDVLWDDYIRFDWPGCQGLARCCFGVPSVSSHPPTLDAAMATVDAQVQANLGPFRTAVDLIVSIPGVKNLGAHVIVSEIGVDMNRFPSAAHLISWACICPRNDESAGKRRSNRVRQGSTWLKTTLVQCAWAAVKKKDSYLQAQFYRIKARRGPKKAIMAVVASILTAIYHMLEDGTMYKDLGRNHFERRSTDQQKERLIKRLADLGYAVEIKPLAA
jgi:transposase